MLEINFGRFFAGGVFNDMLYRVHINEGILTLEPLPPL
jgi:hypothetical protein